MVVETGVHVLEQARVAMQRNHLLTSGRDNADPSKQVICQASMYSCLSELYVFDLIYAETYSADGPA